MAIDAVVACADLVGRAGGTEFQVGWDCPHVPGESDGHNCPDVTWWAHATWRGSRLTRDGFPSPDLACLALAERILDGGHCRCGQPVALTDDATGCRWRLTGQRWESSCTSDPIRVHGKRGDVDAMERAFNRTQRRRNRRRQP